MLPLWFWVMLWVISAYWLVRVVGKPIAESARLQRAAALAAEEAEAAARAAEQASSSGLTPLWIHLEGLTLGLLGPEVEALYGPPAQVEHPSENTVRWRYPLEAEGEGGQPLAGTLVLEFEDARLSRKDFEPDAPAPASETEASNEASVQELGAESAPSASP